MNMNFTPAARALAGGVMAAALLTGCSKKVAAEEMSPLPQQQGGATAQQQMEQQLLQQMQAQTQQPAPQAQMQQPAPQTQMQQQGGGQMQQQVPSLMKEAFNYALHGGDAPPLYHDFGAAMMKALHSPQPVNPAPGQYYQTIDIPSKTGHTIKFHLPANFGELDGSWWDVLIAWYNSQGHRDNIMRGTIVREDLDVAGITNFFSGAHKPLEDLIGNLIAYGRKNNLLAASDKIIEGAAADGVQITMEALAKASLSRLSAANYEIFENGQLLVRDRFLYFSANANTPLVPSFIAFPAYMNALQRPRG